MTEPAAVTLATIVSNIGSVFTGAMGWASTVATTVTNSPILLIGVVIGFVGVGVVLFKRLLNV